MERLFLGFLSFFAMMLGFVPNSRETESLDRTASVTQYGKAEIEYD